MTLGVTYKAVFFFLFFLAYEHYCFEENLCILGGCTGEPVSHFISPLQQLWDGGWLCEGGQSHVFVHLFWSLVSPLPQEGSPHGGESCFIHRSQETVHLNHPQAKYNDSRSPPWSQKLSHRMAPAPVMIAYSMSQSFSSLLLLSAPSVCALGIMPRDLLLGRELKNPFTLQCAFLFS